MIINEDSYNISQTFKRNHAQKRSMSWFKELGFRNYPLDPRSNPDLIGVEKQEEELLTYIGQGNMCLLCGFTGSGKTSMLRRIQRNPKTKRYTFVFISADGVDKQYQIDDAIKDSKSFVDMLLLRKPRRVVVLLDESHLANRILTESIKSKWNFVHKNGDKMIQSVIVSQIENKLGTNFSGSFIDRLGHRVVEMRRLEPEELVQVLRQRMHNGSRNWVDLFDEEGLEFLTKSADGSVRALLEYADVVYRKLFEMEDKPLFKKGFKIDKAVVFNLLQTAGLNVYDSSKSHQKNKFTKLLANEKLREPVEIFEKLGSISAVNLAEKMDITKKESLELVQELLDHDALVESHKDDDGESYYVLTPKLRHELVKA